MSLSGQQWAFKGINFNRCTTGVKTGGFNLVFTSCTFTNCSTGIDASGTTGSLTLLDSNGTNIGALVNSYDSGNAANSLILENIRNNGNTVVLNGNTKVLGNVLNTWVHGNMVINLHPSLLYHH